MESWRCFVLIVAMLSLADCSVCMASAVFLLLLYSWLATTGYMEYNFGGSCEQCCWNAYLIFGLMLGVRAELEKHGLNCRSSSKGKELDI